MSEVTQTITAWDGSGRPNNCLTAAVASLLGLPLDEVPHFLEMDAPWDEALKDFALTVGYRVVHQPVAAAPAIGLAIGVSRRGNMHSVVVRGGEVVWDPHPDRTGLKWLSYYLAWLPMDGRAEQ